MSSFTRRRFLGGLGAAGFPAILRARAQRPDFVFFLTDDQRFDALSCAGNRILQTPHMDRIANEGVRFSQAFVSNSLCSPSRGTIVTGMYSHAHGVTWNTGPSHELNPSLPTFPKLLQQAGYFTAINGKWHIRSMPEGFDHSCILPGQGLYHDPIMIAGRTRVRMRGYVDDVIGDQSIETLRNRPKGRPFCLLCWFKAPHRAWEPPRRYQHAYEDLEIPPPPTFGRGLEDRPNAIRDSDLQIADMPDFYGLGVPATAPREEQKRLNYQHYVKQYYRVLRAVDDNVGRVLDCLDREGLAENTFVLHSADNGFFMGEYGLFDKRMMYEPSIRVPMLARYPAGFRGGRVDGENMVLNNDICHTILDYAGVARPESMARHGASWRPILEGGAAQWRQSWLYEFFEYPAVGCVGKIRGVRTRRSATNSARNSNAFATQLTTTAPRTTPRPRSAPFASPADRGGRAAKRRRAASGAGCQWGGAPLRAGAAGPPNLGGAQLPGGAYPRPAPPCRRPSLATKLD